MGEHPAKWSLSPARVVLAPDDVHVWSVDLKAVEVQVEEAYRILSPDEQQRADRFRYPGGRRRYAIARGSLRRILGSYLEEHPAALRFEYSGLGKPRLGGSYSPRDLDFNVAHSHEMALIAVVMNRAVGVDIEHIRQVRRFLELAERYFSSAEVEALRAIEGDSDRFKAFLTGWTRKEALLKATGKGLSVSLDNVEVTMAPHEDARLLRLDDKLSASGPWQMCHLDPSANYLAALCYHGTPAEVQAWRWTL